MEKWIEFINLIKSYKALYEDLNEPCTENDLACAESDLGLNIPEEFKNIFRINNGQQGNDKGIFRALSGYDVYKRPKLLPLTGVIRIRQELLKNEELKSYFEESYIPFACDHEECPDNIFCYDTLSGAVYLLWVYAPDWTLPADWQYLRIKQTETFDAFIEIQTMYYRLN